ncbi:LysR family transcriptional regulator [Mycobacterium sp. 852013-50091_SCH5140682]|uniref:LysR family transcriptional regulator n=1 Tax=Mycobacterium sp. 852013-50091_SCH5140682 TaxID=1834109 RepID=UPI0007E92E40|nr:LysR family transcriptional regulator [Mycobacterium sp. 852013-50091_SCH5140682]OBC10920.1 LysR family transcriptional regulator [Mycobacterium sp. 852013-50091_SCH5140682]
MVSLRALESLVAVADHGSITRAAEALHSSQPAVSQQLAALERETRTQLFHREGRGVRLTPAGRAALSDARRALDAAAAAMRSARVVGEGGSGSLRLACAQSLTVTFLGPVIQQWIQSDRAVRFTLRESTSMDELVQVLDDDEVDVTFAAAPTSVPDRFTVTPVADEEIVLTTTSDHCLAKQPAVRLDQLDGVPIVHFAPENGLISWLDYSLAEAGVRPDPVMRTAVTASAPQLAATGLGVAITPISAVGEGFPGAVRSFSPRWFRQLVAITPSAPDPLAARFIGELRARGVRVPREIQQQLVTDVTA